MRHALFIATLAILLVTGAAFPQTMGIVVSLGAVAIAIWLYFSFRRVVTIPSSPQLMDHDPSSTSAPLDGSNGGHDGHG
jgi:hypothetical protein